MGSAPSVFAQDQPIEMPDEKDVHVVYNRAVRMPELAAGGGISAVTTVVQQKVKYPAAARRDSIEGRVITSFVVEASGLITHPQIIRGIGGGCNEAALAAIRSLGQLRPAQQNGRAVPTTLTIPVYFVLDPIHHPLPKYSLDGRLRHTSSGRAMSFNDYDEGGSTSLIHAPGINFCFRFGNRRVEEGDRAGAFMLDGKVIRLVVNKLSPQADTTAAGLLSGHIKPALARLYGQFPVDKLTIKNVRVRQGLPAKTFLFNAPPKNSAEAARSQAFISFVYQDLLFILHAGQYQNEYAVDLPKLLLEATQLIQFSARPIVLVDVDR